jgi:hypothetical protein
MGGAIPPVSQYAFMVCCSVKNKHRDNFSFTFLQDSYCGTVATRCCFVSVLFLAGKIHFFYKLQVYNEFLITGKPCSDEAGPSKGNESSSSTETVSKILNAENTVQNAFLFHSQILILLEERGHSIHLYENFDYPQHEGD